MGSACCVAARDKSIIVPNRSAGEALHRNNARYSPTWSFRWDNRGRVSGEELSLSGLSDGISCNFGSDIKYESAFVSEDGSPIESFRKTWSKSSGSDQSISRNTFVDAISEQMIQKCKGSKECPAPSFSSPTKFSLRVASQSSSSTSPLSSQGHLQPTGSTTPKRTWQSPVCRPRLSKQVSDSLVFGISSPNRCSSVDERPGTPHRNELGHCSHSGSSDGWSMNAFSDLVTFSRGESWPCDNELVGFNHEKLSRHNKSSSSEQQMCGACSRHVLERSLWSSQKIMATNELSVVAVLTCGHVYHADCLEHMTPEIDKYDPACPICLLGEKKTQKMSEKALKAEMDVKARNNKKPRKRVVDGDLDRSDVVMFDWTMGSGQEGKSPKSCSSSTLKSNAPKPFLSRHFSIGSKGISRSSQETQPIRRKGFFWAKSSKI